VKLWFTTAINVVGLEKLLRKNNEQVYHRVAVTVLPMTEEQTLNAIYNEHPVIIYTKTVYLLVPIGEHFNNPVHSTLDNMRITVLQGHLRDLKQRRISLLEQKTNCKIPMPTK
jgi:hypothetical protein